MKNCPYCGCQKTSKIDYMDVVGAKFSCGTIVKIPFNVADTSNFMRRTARCIISQNEKK